MSETTPDAGAQPLDPDLYPPSSSGPGPRPVTGDDLRYATLSLVNLALFISTGLSTDEADPWWVATLDFVLLVVFLFATFAWAARIGRSR